MKNIARLVLCIVFLVVIVKVLNTDFTNSKKANNNIVMANK